MSKLEWKCYLLRSQPLELPKNTFWGWPIQQGNHSMPDVHLCNTKTGSTVVLSVDEDGMIHVPAVVLTGDWKPVSYDGIIDDLCSIFIDNLEPPAADVVQSMKVHLVDLQYISAYAALVELVRAFGIEAVRLALQQIEVSGALFDESIP